MIVRFFHADRDVVAAVKRAVHSSPRLLLVTQLKGPRDLAVENRTPFRELLGATGDWLDLYLLIDEGKPEGMWRDPMGELCDELFPDKKDAASATAGYVLAQHGRALASFRKALWDPLEDAETISAEVAERVQGLKPFVRPPAAPEPEARPKRPPRTRTPVINQVVNPPGAAAPRRAAKTQEVPAASRIEDDEPTPVPAARRVEDDEPTPVPAASRIEDDDPTPVPPKPPPPTPAAPPPEPPPLDPYRILGLTPGVTHEEAKKAWRALLMQYHPDKVAHLAPEFQTLAEERTRNINAAWAQIENALRG